MQTTRRLNHRAIWAALAITTVFSVCQTARAQEEAVTGNPPETPETVRGSQQNPSPVEAGAEAEAKAAEKEAAPVTSLHFSGDLYYGRSNLADFKSLRDGLWAAGTGPSLPSVLQFNLSTRNGSEAKLALGVGRLYSYSDSTIEQPRELWYRAPVSAVSLTLGKFYVPFALQEWQYETRWGAMLEGESGATTWAASANYNQTTNQPNIYSRIGRNFGEKLNVGLSLGAGRGLSYSSVHDKALGLDVTASRKAWNLYGEFLAMRGDSNQRFNFGWLKLEYAKWGKFKPYIAHWRWRDTAEELGNLRSHGIGASYNILPQLAVEAGFAHTTDQNVKWIQFHWTPDWKLWAKENRASASNEQARNAFSVPAPLLPARRP